MIIVFSLFSWVMCIQPFYRRFIKFMNASAECAFLPEDASSERRRSSVEALEKAAADVFGHHQLDEELAAMFVNRKVSRRSTMPAFMTRTRRSSWALLRSSAGDISRVLSQMATYLDDEKLKTD